MGELFYLMDIAVDLLGKLVFRHWVWQYAWEITILLTFLLIIYEVVVSTKQWAKNWGKQFKRNNLGLNKTALTNIILKVCVSHNSVFSLNSFCGKNYQSYWKYKQAYIDWIGKL